MGKFPSHMMPGPALSNFPAMSCILRQYGLRPYGRARYPFHKRVSRTLIEEDFSWRENIHLAPDVEREMHKFKRGKDQ